LRKKVNEETVINIAHFPTLVLTNRFKGWK